MACELDYECNREIFDLRLDVDIRCKWRALSTSNPPLPRMCALRYFSRSFMETGFSVFFFSSVLCRPVPLSRTQSLLAAFHSHRKTFHLRNGLLFPTTQNRWSVKPQLAREVSGRLTCPCPGYTVGRVACKIGEQSNRPVISMSGAIESSEV